VRIVTPPEAKLARSATTARPSGEAIAFVKATASSNVRSATSAYGAPVPSAFKIGPSLTV
jgi:hypothetical protein